MYECVRRCVFECVRVCISMMFTCFSSNPCPVPKKVMPSVGGSKDSLRALQERVRRRKKTQKNIRDARQETHTQHTQHTHKKTHTRTKTHTHTRESWDRLQVSDKNMQTRLAHSPRVSAYACPACVWHLRGWHLLTRLS